ncbi:response regulator transcription factor [Bacillus infantis]|uniref:response regulator transcription factor n=1 Tax=Bacillus infantis TaxID=324767 RepID=UPI003CF14A92
MYSILIVDDEKKERSIIKILIERFYPEVFCIHEATNGINAIELMSNINPDLIFMDIQMPGISGIEAIKEIRKFNKDSYIVILSAFNYFEYAKEAIKEGVNNYLLKPLSRQEFNTEMQSFFDYYQNVRLNERKQTELLSGYRDLIEENLVTALAFNSFNIERLNTFFDILKLDGDYGICILIRDDILISHRRIINAIQKSIRDRTSLEYKIISNIINGKLTLFIISNKELGIESRLLKEIILSVQQDNQELKFGAGGVYQGKQNFYHSYDEALASVLTNSAVGNTSEDVQEMGMEISKLIRENKPSEVTNLLAKLLNDMENSQFSLNKIKTSFIELMASVTRNILPYRLQDAYISEYSSILDINHISEISRISETYIVTLAQTVNKEELYITHHVIDRAKKYVIENYEKDITVNFLAEKFSLNPYYFSVLFKKNENKNFIAFLTDIRMENAIKLMKETDKSIKEISITVGYQDQNYFSKVFKRKLGKSPKEYRKIFK